MSAAILRSGFAFAPHNAKNGLPESPAQRKARIEEAVADPEVATWSDNRIAEFVGATNKTVSQYRPNLGKSQVEKRVGKDGKARKPRAPDPAKEAVKVKVNAEKKVATAMTKLAEVQADGVVATRPPCPPARRRCPFPASKRRGDTLARLNVKSGGERPGCGPFIAGTLAQTPL